MALFKVASDTFITSRWQDAVGGKVASDKFFPLLKWLELSQCVGSSLSMLVVAV